MRRITPLLVILAAVLILPSVAFAGPRSHAWAGKAPRHAFAVPRSSAVVPRATGTITGVVKAYDGSAMVGATVVWWYESSPNTWVYGQTTTDGLGQFTLANVPVTTSGELDVTRADKLQGYDLTNLNFFDGASFTIQPGQIAFSTDHAAADHMWVETDGPAGSCWAKVYSISDFVPVLAPSVTYAVAYWADWEGKEWWAGSPITVTPGGTSIGAIFISETGAQWTYVSSPYWRSGAPKSKVTLTFENWLAPMTAQVWVLPEDPKATTNYYWTNLFVGDTRAMRSYTITLPKALRPGYTLDVRAVRKDDSDSTLYLDDYFQVCTLVSTKTSISHGTGIRLSGVVPTDKHTKKVVVYSRTTTAGQPTNWNTPKGWKRGATLTASVKGAYKSALLHPAHTTWYIVRYPADSSGNWAAFTSVIKVTVH